MERFHRGIGQPGFFQKDVVKGFPEWLKRVEVPKHGGTVHHPIANDVRSLLWLANQNSITVHVWPSRSPRLYNPDVCVFDLDPSKVGENEILCAVAIEVRDLLTELGLPSWVKTSGSKGLHIAVPLDGKADFGTVARFAHAVGRLLVQRDPKNLTQEFSKADRGGRILVDTGRNGYSATFAAAYSVRARPGAPISAPCTWREVERCEVGPVTFTLRTMAERIAASWRLVGRYDSKQTIIEETDCKPGKTGRRFTQINADRSGGRSRKQEAGAGGIGKLVNYHLTFLNYIWDRRKTLLTYYKNQFTKFLNDN